MSQTICFKLFLKLFGVPLEHPSCAHQKMDYPKWTPKSSQGNRTEHLFSRLILQNFALRDTFGGRSQRALHLENQ